MQLQKKATSLWGNFFKLGMPQIRAFHMTENLGGGVTQFVMPAVFALLVRFSPEAETEASRAYQAALRQKETVLQPPLEPALA